MKQRDPHCAASQSPFRLKHCPVCLWCKCTHFCSILPQRQATPNRHVARLQRSQCWLTSGRGELLPQVAAMGCFLLLSVNRSIHFLSEIWSFFRSSGLVYMSGWSLHFPYCIRKIAVAPEVPAPVFLFQSVRDLRLAFALTCFRKVWSTHVRRILTRRCLSALISLYSFFNPPFRTVCKWPHTGPSKLKYHMILTPIAGVHLCFPLLLILCKLSCPIMMQLSNLLDCNIGILFAKAFWFTSGRTGDFYAEINQNHALNAWYTQAL